MTTRPTLPGSRWWLGVAAALVRRPDLWATAVVMALRLARPGWWRRAPFLPLPAAEYLRFRMETQYGGDGTAWADPRDLVTYLAWCRRTRVR